jgi:acid stress-induced BolA-like protein IbaG/YrbA
MLAAHGGGTDDEVVMVEHMVKEKRNVKAEKRIKRRLIFCQLCPPISSSSIHGIHPYL